MSWITITTDNVKTRLAGAELAALQSKALASGQSDPLPDIISQVVSEVRGYVAACRRNQLGDGVTIPEKLLGAALAMIRYRLATRLPNVGILTQERTDENRQAITLLERVSDCKFTIEEPTVVSTEQSGIQSPKISPRDHGFTSSDQDGV